MKTAIVVVCILAYAIVGTAFSMTYDALERVECGRDADPLKSATIAIGWGILIPAAIVASAIVPSHLRPKACA